ncbi:MAG: hypothetical protein ACI3YG_09605 [Prevotella sp.]
MYICSGKRKKYGKNEENFETCPYLGRKMLFLSHDRVCGAKVYGLGEIEIDEPDEENPQELKKEQWCLFKGQTVVVAKKSSECFHNVDSLTTWIIKKAEKEWDRMEEEEREENFRIIYDK